MRPMLEDAHTIDQVIERLDGIIDRASLDSSRLGYFPALYRKVTRKVKEGIGEGFFEDGARMERLDVLFANRYIRALDAWKEGRAPTESWRYAFAAAGQRRPIVLQHLLLGINAHINLDLGIAAARTVTPSRLESLRVDFNRINLILAQLVGDVQKELADIWPMLRLLNRHLGSAEDTIINFSMKRARDHAWSVAQRLAPLDPAAQDEEIGRLDTRVALRARLIRHPGYFLGLVTMLVRLGEWKTVRETIRILS